MNFDPNCMKLALDFAGADHIVAGSDYPQMIGSMTKMQSVIDSLGLTPEEREKVRSGSARRILGI